MTQRATDWMNGLVEPACPRCGGRRWYHPNFGNPTCKDCIARRNKELRAGTYQSRLPEQSIVTRLKGMIARTQRWPDGQITSLDDLLVVEPGGLVNYGKVLYTTVHAWANQDRERLARRLGLSAGAPRHPTTESEHAHQPGLNRTDSGRVAESLPERLDIHVWIHTTRDPMA